MSLLKMPLKELNPHILCVLCGGYLVDATTIIECLHSFCRRCIVKYLQTSFHCPVCDAEVHKTKPLLHIRSDRPLQDIVNKLVPGLVYDELHRRQEFEAKLKNDNETEIASNSEEEKPVNTSSNKNSAQVEMEDPVYVTLEYYRRKRNWNEKQVFPTRYLRCPSAVTVRVLKKFLVAKFAIPNTHQAEIVRSDELLSDCLTMKEVSQIYGLYSKSFLDLQYSFLDVCDDSGMKTGEKNERVSRKKRKIHEENRVENTCERIEEHPPSENRIELDSDSVKFDSMLVEHPYQNNAILSSFPETPPTLENEEAEDGENQITTFL